MKNNDLKWIKKNYGETMMKVCRKNFPTLLEVEGLLPSLLINNFHISKNLINDILIQSKEEEFMLFIFSKVNEITLKKLNSDKITYELIQEAGDRINKSNINNDFELMNYVKGPDNKFYKYNVEIQHIFYCVDNIVIMHNRIQQYDKEKYLLMENHLIDFSNKNIKDLTPFPNPSVIFNDIDKIETIKDNNTNGKSVVIKEKNTIKESVFTLNENNEIIKADLPNLKKVNSGFLINNKKLESISLPQAKMIVGSFLSRNQNLIEIDLPNVEEINDNFLTYNKKLSKINLPSAKYIGYGFLRSNEELTEINLPKVETISREFLSHNKKLSAINLPNVKTIEDSFLRFNEELTEINLPKVETIDNEFLSHNKKLSAINLPNVKTIEDSFLRSNEELTEIILPKIKMVGKNFLYENTSLKDIKFLNFVIMQGGFLHKNEIISLAQFMRDAESEQKNSGKLLIRIKPDNLDETKLSDVLKELTNLIGIEFSKEIEEKIYIKINKK